jgi:protein gp37
MADVFDKNAPPGARERLWHLILQTPELDWLLLTKRIGNARAMLPRQWLETRVYGTLPSWPANLRIGSTFCNQGEVERDMRKLLDLSCPNFASFEPLLGPINLERVERRELDGREGDEEWMYEDNALSGFTATRGGGHDGKRLDWAIAGGESGPHARPMHPAWARSLRDQCEKARTPFHFKQWGEWLETEAAPIDPRSSAIAGNLCRVQTPGRPDHYRAVSPDRGVSAKLERVGVVRAGRRLDGLEHNAFPK